MTPNRITTLSLVGAPIGILAGWAGMRTGGSGGREPLWTLSHLAWFIGYSMLAIVCWDIYRRIRATGRANPALSKSAVALAVTGGVAIVGQMIIDLVGGLATGNEADMDELSDDIAGLPGMEAAFYDVGPHLIFLGLLMLAVVGWRTVAIPTNSAVWIGTAILVAGVDQIVDIPLRSTMAAAAIVLLMGFLPLTHNPAIAHDPRTAPERTPAA